MSAGALGGSAARAPCAGGAAPPPYRARASQLEQQPAPFDVSRAPERRTVRDRHPLGEHDGIRREQRLTPPREVEDERLQHVGAVGERRAAASRSPNTTSGREATPVRHRGRPGGKLDDHDLAAVADVPDPLRWIRHAAGEEHRRVDRSAREWHEPLSWVPPRPARPPVGTLGARCQGALGNRVSRDLNRVPRKCALSAASSPSFRLAEGFHEPGSQDSGSGGSFRTGAAASHRRSTVRGSAKERLVSGHGVE